MAGPSEQGAGPAGSRGPVMTQGVVHAKLPDQRVTGCAGGRAVEGYPTVLPVDASVQSNAGGRLTLRFASAAMAAPRRGRGAPSSPVRGGGSSLAGRFFPAICCGR